MMSPTFIADALLAAAGVAAGGLLGLVYFAALRRAVGAFVVQQRWPWLIAWSLARIVGAVAVLAVIARFGALALLAALFGFLLARGRSLRSRGGAAGGCA